MNELAFKLCKHYIDGLVEAIEATADVRERFKLAAKTGFMSDINGTLDMHYDTAQGQKRLLDIFLADVVEAGGHVELYSGLPGQDLSSFDLRKACDRMGKDLKITAKPLSNWQDVPAIVLEDQKDLLTVAKLRGFVAVDPMDEELEEFLGNWDRLRGSLDQAEWAEQRAVLLAPFVSH